VTAAELARLAFLHPDVARRVVPIVVHVRRELEGAGPVLERWTGGRTGAALVARVIEVLDTPPEALELALELERAGAHGTAAAVRRLTRGTVLEGH